MLNEQRNTQLSDSGYFDDKSNVVNTRKPIEHKPTKYEEDVYTKHRNDGTIVVINEKVVNYHEYLIVDGINKLQELNRKRYDKIKRLKERIYNIAKLPKKNIWQKIILWFIGRQYYAYIKSQHKDVVKTINSNLHDKAYSRARLHIELLYGNILQLSTYGNQKFYHLNQHICSMIQKLPSDQRKNFTNAMQEALTQMLWITMHDGYDNKFNQQKHPANTLAMQMIVNNVQELLLNVDIGKFNYDKWVAGNDELRMVKESIVLDNVQLTHEDTMQEKSNESFRERSNAIVDKNSIIKKTMANAELMLPNDDNVSYKDFKENAPLIQQSSMVSQNQSSDQSIFIDSYSDIDDNPYIDKNLLHDMEGLRLSTVEKNESDMNREFINERQLLAKSQRQSFR